MVGVLAGLGILGSMSVAYIVVLVAGLLMPHASDAGRTALSVIFFVSVAVSVYLMVDYMKVVEKKGWKAIFHPLTLVMLGNTLGAVGLTALVSA